MPHSYESPPFSSKNVGALSSRPDSINELIKREVLNSVMNLNTADDPVASLVPADGPQKDREVAKTM